MFYQCQGGHETEYPWGGGVRGGEMGGNEGREMGGNEGEEGNEGGRGGAMGAQKHARC